MHFLCFFVGIIIDNQVNNVTHPIIEIFLFCFSITFINILFNEGLFIFKQKGVPLKERFKLLKDNYTSV